MEDKSPRLDPDEWAARLLAATEAAEADLLRNPSPYLAGLLADVRKLRDILRLHLDGDRPAGAEED